MIAVSIDGRATSRCRPSSHPVSTRTRSTTEARLGFQLAPSRPATPPSRPTPTSSTAWRRADQGAQAVRGQHHAARWGQPQDKAGKLDGRPGPRHVLRPRHRAERPSAWTLFTVSGVDTGAAMPAGTTRTAVDSANGPRARAIPRNGWLKFKNRLTRTTSSPWSSCCGQDAGGLRRFLEEGVGPPPVDFGSPSTPACSVPATTWR